MKRIDWIQMFRNGIMIDNFNAYLMWTLINCWRLFCFALANIWFLCPNPPSAKVLAINFGFYPFSQRNCLFLSNWTMNLFKAVPEVIASMQAKPTFCNGRYRLGVDGVCKRTGKRDTLKWPVCVLYFLGFLRRNGNGNKW